MRRWAKIAALVIVALVLLAFLASNLLILWGNRRIRREIEAVKALHEPTTWEELRQADRQGHVVLAPGATSQKEMASLYSQGLAGAKGWNEALPQEFQTRLGKEALSAEEAQRLGEALSHYQEAIGLFRKAAQYDGIVTLPERFVKPGQAEIDEMSLMREAARLLKAQACYSAAQGSADDAADACLVLLRYARAFPGYNESAGLVHFAISGVACRTIEQVETLTPSSAEKLEALMESLRPFLDDMPLPRIFCAERVYGSSLFQSGWPQLPKFSLRPNHAAYLETMRELVAVSREPFPSSLQEMEKMASVSATPPGPRQTFNIFAHMIPAAMNSALKNGAQSQARIRATLVSLAIRRARLDGMPLPAKLQELVPKYLPAVPTDPFTGEPLGYRVDEIGCEIYSVGPDAADNGRAVKAAIENNGLPRTAIIVLLQR